jgi:hypothetical protein
VCGNAIHVAQQNGSATVDFASSTRVSSLAPAQLSDVTAGSCVAVRPTRGSDAGGATVTAAGLQIVPSSSGQCPQRHGGRQVIGAVPTSVSVTDATRYAKRTPANAQAISQGECLSASGTKDDGVDHRATRKERTVSGLSQVSDVRCDARCTVGVGQ